MCIYSILCLPDTKVIPCPSETSEHKPRETPSCFPSQTINEQTLVDHNDALSTVILEIEGVQHGVLDNISPAVSDNEIGNLVTFTRDTISDIYGGNMYVYYRDYC